MTVVTFYIPDDSVALTVVPENPVILELTNNVISTGGGGGGTEKRLFNFVNADVATNGNITFYHNLSDQIYVDYSVFMPGVGEVYPDSDSYDINALTINLKSFMPLTGMWSILIEGN